MRLTERGTFVKLEAGYRTTERHMARSNFFAREHTSPLRDTHKTSKAGAHRVASDATRRKRALLRRGAGRTLVLRRLLNTDCAIYNHDSNNKDHKEKQLRYSMGVAMRSLFLWCVGHSDKGRKEAGARQYCVCSKDWKSEKKKANRKK